MTRKEAIAYIGRIYRTVANRDYRAAVSIASRNSQAAEKFIIKLNESSVPIQVRFRKEVEVAK